MRTIKIEKTIEEMPIERAVSLASQALKRPNETSDKVWQNQLRADFLSGRKFFRIREVRLLEQV